MKLIHFQGLNCYHDCIITLAAAFGLDYTATFSRLWSEGQLYYDPICHVFLSRRIKEALAYLGLKLDPPCIIQNEQEEKWTDIPAGDYAIAGMDAFRLPWNPLYQLLHGPHYFIVQKSPLGIHNCFDPTYGINGPTLSTQKLLLDSYALITVKTDSAMAPPLYETLFSQSLEVLKCHPETLHFFLKQANAWIEETPDTALLPAKYADTLLNNRCLYSYYLKKWPDTAKTAPLFCSQNYYDEWRTVKNGFYKAALTRPNHAAFDETCQLLRCLFEQEMELAGQICHFS